MEAVITETVRVFQEEYINPFEKSVDETSLFNICSGVPLPDEIADSLLECYSKGFMDDFKGRFVNDEVSFHDPIRRNKFKSFKDANQKTPINKNKKDTTV